MHRLLRRTLMVALAALGLAPVAAADSFTMTVDTVDAGDSWECDGLLFSDFAFVLPADASLFTLRIEGTTVSLEGPMEVSSGETADVALSYRVTAVDPLIGVTGVRFTTPTDIQAAGTATSMQAVSSFRDGASAEVTSLANFVLEGSNVAETEDDFDPEPILSVQAIASLVASSQPGDFVDLASVSHTYTLVPEPSTAVLLALGLLGLVAGSRRP